MNKSWIDKTRLQHFGHADLSHEIPEVEDAVCEECGVELDSEIERETNLCQKCYLELVEQELDDARHPDNINRI